MKIFSANHGVRIRIQKDAYFLTATITYTHTHRYEEISKVRLWLITALFVTCAQQEPLCPNGFYIHTESLISFIERILLRGINIQHKFNRKINSINLTAVISLQELN